MVLASKPRPRAKTLQAMRAKLVGERDRQNVAVSTCSAMATASVQEMDAYPRAEKFPDRLWKIPVVPQKFPAPMNREFGSKPPKTLG
jgi:hypothetical protein